MEHDDALSAIEEEARKVAREFGALWDESAANRLKSNLANRLGGTQIYIPRNDPSDRRLRDFRIINDFNGLNIKQLARKFQMSERSIRRIIKRKCE